MKYRWGNKPLSARGSLQDPGGRFNIGEIDTTRFPPFSGLYIASDKETSIQEILLGSSPMMEQGGIMLGMTWNAKAGKQMGYA